MPAGPPATGGPDPEGLVGLRQRSKAKRRALIQRTAMRLFAERGYEHTTVADIADAAEVAPRTISAYFPTKADLARSVADEISVRLASAFAEQPVADLLRALDAWLTEEEQQDPDLSALAKAMYDRNPDLRALSTASVSGAIEEARTALLAYLGLPADHPMSQLCTAAFGATLTSYLNLLAQHPPTPELHRAVLAYLEAILDAAQQTAASYG